jgi:hypothetical protein
MNKAPMNNTEKRIKTNALKNSMTMLAPAFLLTGAYMFFEYNYSWLLFISPEKTLRPLFAMWLLLPFVAFLLYQIIRHPTWTGLALYGFVLIFYTSELYFNVIFYSSLTILVIWAGIAYLVRKRRIKTGQVLFIMTLTPVIFFLFTLFTFMRIYLAPDWSAYSHALARMGDRLPAAATPPETKPDIYYIVLDGYGRADILQDYYGFDNTEFIEYLQNKGFILPPALHANYAKTAVSVTTTLNFNYIEEFVPGVEDSLFWWLANPFLRRSYTRLFLEDMGYTSVSIATDWDITNNQESDIYFKPLPIHFTELEGNLLEKSKMKSVIAPLVEPFAFYPTIPSHRELIRYNFETLEKIPGQIPGPKFVFAHIVAPHPPFVFDADGNPATPNHGFTFNDANDFLGTKEDYRNGYVAQIQHVNTMVKQLIETLLRDSETPPIIILQADHGPGMLTDFTSAENTCIKERFSIFGAYYLPGKQPDVIPNDLTPVNLFRIIFNEYFATDLPLLENSSYYFKDTVYIYRTEDVSARLDEGSPFCVMYTP